MTSKSKAKAGEPTARERQSEAVRRALKTLERAGKLTPEQVVEAARDRKSVLHALFEWDDAKAASAWRLEQARGLIRSVQVMVTVGQDRTISVPVYVRDPNAESDEQGYQALDDIKDNPEAARAALDIELMRVEGLLSRAEGIAEALGLVEQVQRLTRRTKALRKLAQPQANA